MEFQGPKGYQQWLDIYDHKTTTASRDEISPKWTLTEKLTGGSVVIGNLTENIVINSTSPENIYFTVSKLSKPAWVTILKNYFPGWKLSNLSSHVSIPLAPDKIGNITALLSDGSYRLNYVGTDIQHLSNFISIFTLLFLLVSSIKSFFKKNE
jgi:hypothetical protein